MNIISEAPALCYYKKWLTAAQFTPRKFHICFRTYHPVVTGTSSFEELIYVSTLKMHFT